MPRSLFFSTAFAAALALPALLPGTAAQAQVLTCATMGTLTGSSARNASTPSFTVSTGDVVTVVATGTAGAQIEVSFLSSTQTRTFPASGTETVTFTIGTLTGSTATDAVTGSIISGVSGIDISVTCAVGTASSGGSGGGSSGSSSGSSSSSASTLPAAQTYQDISRRATALRFGSAGIVELAPQGGMPFRISGGGDRLAFAGSLSAILGSQAGKLGPVPADPIVVPPLETRPVSAPGRRVGSSAAPETPFSATPWDIWASGQISFESDQGGGGGTQGALTLGATYLAAPDALYGVSFSYGLGETDGSTVFESQYLGLNLYGSFRQPSGLTFTPYLSYLQTDTDVSRTGATGSYTADTIVGGARLSARRMLEDTRDLTRYFEPNAEIALGRDDRPSYTMSDATVVAASDESFGLLSLGPTWGQVRRNPRPGIARMETRIGFGLEWSFIDDGTGGDDLGGALKAGLALVTDGGGAFSVTLDTTGLGRDADALGLGFHYTKAFD
ncbi:MAG: hypothetical protein AAF841_12660 [Pseudomonadota bacterium]